MSNNKNRMNLKVWRGKKIEMNPTLIPTDAVETKATVIRDNIFDPKVGIFHKVMFNSGTNGVIFKSILDSEVKENN